MWLPSPAPRPFLPLLVLTASGLGAAGGHRAVDSLPQVYFEGLACRRVEERLLSGGPCTKRTWFAYSYAPLAQALAPLTALIPAVVVNWV